MDKLNTVDSLLEHLQKLSKEKGIIDPNTYLAVAEKLNSLLQDEQHILFMIEHCLATLRTNLLQEGKTSSATKMIVEASDDYLEARKQKAKIDRVLETIRLAKIHARLSTDIYKSN